jgi:hypothetical protein
MTGTQLVTPERIVAVLLADGWHRVSSGSFTVGALFDDDRGVLGFRFEEVDADTYGTAVLAGPLETIIAVRQVDGAGRRRRSYAANGAGRPPTR